MELRSVLGKVLFFLTISFPQASADTHSLQYLYTAVTPGINFPEFTAVGLVDRHQFVYYDSNIRKMIPRTAWMNKIDADDPDYWNRRTRETQSHQENLKQLLATVTQRYNHTKGVHTVQMMYGCELDDDGSTRGYSQYGYDGEDFISFDLKTKTWIASKPQALITKHKWDNDPGMTVGQKNYLENTCIERLKKHVSYGRETLERKVRPEMSVFQQESSPEVVCHATGFFPKALNISWQKDGADVLEDVELRETLPNQDGSFQKRSILTVPAEELQEHTYTCVIQHSSLEKELVQPVYEPRILRGLHSESLISSTLEAEAGDTVTIWCQHDLNYQGSIFWFKHTSDSVPRLLGCRQIFISAASSSTCPYFTEPERMVMSVQGRFTSLTITAVNVSDTGLYYCSSVQMDRMNFSNSTSFHVKDRNKILSENLDRATGSVSSAVFFMLIVVFGAVIVILLAVLIFTILKKKTYRGVEAEDN